MGQMFSPEHADVVPHSQTKCLHDVCMLEQSLYGSTGPPWWGIPGRVLVGLVGMWWCWHICCLLKTFLILTIPKIILLEVVQSVCRELGVVVTFVIEIKNA